MRISDWSSDVCSSDLIGVRLARLQGRCQKPHAMTDQTATPRAFSASAPLKGRIAIQGDKSISNRSLMLSALAVGESRVTGLLEGHDVLATAAAMRARSEEQTYELQSIMRISYA